MDIPVNQPDPKDPVAEATLPNISFGKAATKAMMSSGDLLTSGNKIKVYDLLSSFSGTISGWDGSSPYIADEIVYNGTEIWKYASNGVYPWTSTGTHRFFGYLSHDAIDNKDVTALFTPSLTTTATSASLSVPEIAFNTSTTQFDFIYSDMVTRNAADKNYQVVPLSFKHLFTALSVQVENTSDVKVRVNSITFENLKNKNNAKITFGDPSDVVYGTTPSASGSFFPAMPSELPELERNEKYDALTTQKNPIERTFFMLWPLTAEQVSPSTPETDPDRIADGCEYKATDSLILVNYQMYVEEGGVWKWTDARTTRMKIPEIAWEAGKKNHFTIQFTDKIIQLTCSVLPWEFSQYDVDYSEGSVVVPAQLKYDASTCNIDDVTKTVTYNGRSIKATFTIMAPVGGIWTVGMKGDTQFFSITPSSGVINPDVDGGKVTLTITPNLTLPRTSDKTIKLSFSVTKGGREVDANDEINRDNYTVLLPKQ